MKARWLLILSLAAQLARSEDPQKEANERLRLSVARIELRIMDPSELNSPKIPPDLAPKFVNGTYQLGTGFLFNDQGDILSAAEVGFKYQDAKVRLESVGIKSGAYFVFGADNYDTPDAIIKFHTVAPGGQLTAIITTDDLSLFMTGVNPRYIQPHIQADPAIGRVTPFQFHIGRARIGDEVYIGGFLPDAYAPNATLGRIVTEEWIQFSQLNVRPEWRIKAPAHVYKIDVEGNGLIPGAPVIRRSDNTVIGLVAETSSGTNYTTVIPAEMAISGLKAIKASIASDSFAVWSKRIVLVLLAVFIFGLFVYALIRLFRKKAVLPTA